MNKKVKTFWVLLLAVFFVSGCSAGSRPESTAAPQAAGEASYDNGIAQNDIYYAGEADYAETTEPEMSMPATEESLPEEAPMPAPTQVPVGGAAMGSELRPEKIIQTANVSMQTDRYDEVTAQLRIIAPNRGGYVESASSNAAIESERYFNITLRVPTDQFDSVLKEIESYAHVVNTTQNAEDVTARYYDLAGRLETKKIEEERVLDMITRAKLIEDLLALEQRLGEIRADIERYQSQINGIDRQAAFSTIYVSLSEVSKEELIVASEGLGERIRLAFTRSINGTVRFFQDTLVFLAGALIPLAVIGVLVLVGIKTAMAAHHKQANKTPENNRNKRSDTE